MHDVLGAETLIPNEVNMGLDRICGSNMVLRMSLRKHMYLTICGYGSLDISVIYEKHWYRCPMGLYTSIGDWP